MDYGKREAGGPIWILYSHNPLISDLGYLVTRDFFKSFLGCKNLFICKNLFLIFVSAANYYYYYYYVLPLHVPCSYRSNYHVSSIYDESR